MEPMYPVDVYLNDEIIGIRTLLREFTEKEIIPRRKQIDEDLNFETAREIYKKLKDLGLQSYFAPEEYGGGGAGSAINTAIMSEELSRGDGGIAISMAVSCAGPWLPIEIAHNKTLLDKMGPQWCGDEVMSFCTVFTEPEGGCDTELYEMAGKTFKTAARLEGDEYVINGQKTWPANAGRYPGWMFVACTTDPSLGHDGIAMMYVPMPTEGLVIDKPEQKMGYRGCMNGTMYFDNVRVPKEYRVAGPGMDANLYYASLNVARHNTAAQAVGVAQSAFEEVLKYTADRMGGGKKVREHSMIKSIIADMAMGIETARAAVMNVAWMLDHPDTYGPPWSAPLMSKVAMSRVYACEVAEKVASKGVELMGATGSSRECAMEKIYRDSKMLSLWLGGVQTNRYEIVRPYYE
jgi:alkylation response protein AidB-like acyl-CoA dehydrogenase